MTLGEDIIQRRNQLGWTQTRLAEEAKVKQPTLQKIESGSRPNPRYETLSKIAHALGTTYEALYSATHVEPKLPIDRLGSLEARVSDLEKQLLDALQLGREAVALAQRAQRVKSRRRTVATKP